MVRTWRPGVAVEAVDVSSVGADRTVTKSSLSKHYVRKMQKANVVLSQ